MTDPLGVNLLPASGEWVYDTVPAPLAAGRADCACRPEPQCRASRHEDGLFLCHRQFAGDHSGLRHSLSRLRLRSATRPMSPNARSTRRPPISAGRRRRSRAVRGRPTHGVAPVSRKPRSVSSRCLNPAAPMSTAARRPIPSIVRCIRDLRARGLRVTFYPFILMDAPGYPWRGRISYGGSDISQAASTAVAGFLGGAAPSQFTRDHDEPHRRLRRRRDGLHLPPDDPALCKPLRPWPAGVDLFLVGSELRGLETLRGPAWTKAGTIAADGNGTLGLSLRRRPRAARHRCAIGIRWSGPRPRPSKPAQSRRLFRRLVGLDWLPTSRHRRPMAASRRALGVAGDRPRLIRQLPAAVGLDQHWWARRRQLERAEAGDMAARRGRDERPRPLGTTVSVIASVSQGQISRAVKNSHGSMPIRRTSAAGPTLPARRRKCRCRRAIG